MSTVTAEQFLLVGGIVLLALILLGIGVIGALRSRNPDPAAHKAVTSDKPAPEWLKGLADTASCWSTVPLAMSTTATWPPASPT